jgi:UDP-N-acetylglucosamine 2-epimerase (non-hydrolysing)
MLSEYCLSSKQILVVFGTRPEAIKMAPVVARLRRSPEVRVSVCVSAQHRQMLDQVLALFGIEPDFDLDLMRPNQTLAGITSAVLDGVTRVIEASNPDLVLVHGDTTTSFATALACFYRRIPVGHVEAGLRTGNLQAPWPEEMNRLFTGRLAALHFAPTPAARDNLLREGVSRDSVWVTGNTVIDALMGVVERLQNEPKLVEQLSGSMPWLADADRRVVLVTGHRRENFGDGMEGVCRALAKLAADPDVDIVYPVHPNPNVLDPVNRLLGGIPNVHLIPPMDYLPFVYLMSRAYFVVTDSGGVQEEAPSLGKPVLVMRDTTERPEAVSAGTVLTVGVDEERIVTEARRLLYDFPHYQRMSTAYNPYGDGHAADRIAKIIEGQREIHEFN